MAVKLKETGLRIVEATPTSVVRHLAEAQESMESGDRIRRHEQSIKNARERPDPGVQKILDSMNAANPEMAERIGRQDAERRSSMRSVPYTNIGYNLAGQYIRMAEGTLTTANGIAEELGDGGLRAGLEAVTDTIKQMKKTLESRENRIGEEL